jgi:hypothetical protein
VVSETPSKLFPFLTHFGPLCRDALAAATKKQIDKFDARLKMAQVLKQEVMTAEEENVIRFLNEKGGVQQPVDDDIGVGVGCPKG